jgi:Tol biopolymer transport system component
MNRLKSVRQHPSLVLALLVALAGCDTDDGCATGNPLMPQCAEVVAPPLQSIVFQSDRDGNFEIYSMRSDGLDVRRLTSNPGDDVQPRWSPDGTQIVFSSLRDGLAAREIFVMNSDGSNIRRLTSLGRATGLPDWSPDGARITFHAARGDGNFDIHVMDSDGTDLSRLTTTGSNLQPRWSPDGQQIAFIWMPAGTTLSRIATMKPDGTGIRLLSSQGIVDGVPSWSPDGTRIAFTSTREIRELVGTGMGMFTVLAVVNADGTEERMIGSGIMGGQPTWSRESGRIFYVHHAIDQLTWDRIHSMRADGTDVRRVSFPVNGNDHLPHVR